jgi:hypothetical protein
MFVGTTNSIMAYEIRLSVHKSNKLRIFEEMKESISMRNSFSTLEKELQNWLQTKTHYFMEVSKAILACLKFSLFRRKLDLRRKDTKFLH